MQNNSNKKASNNTNYENDVKNKKIINLYNKLKSNYPQYKNEIDNAYSKVLLQQKLNLNCETDMFNYIVHEAASLAQKNNTIIISSEGCSLETISTPLKEALNCYEGLADTAQEYLDACIRISTVCKVYGEYDTYSGADGFAAKKDDVLLKLSYKMGGLPCFYTDRERFVTYAKNKYFFGKYANLFTEKEIIMKKINCHNELELLKYAFECFEKKVEPPEILFSLISSSSMGGTQNDNSIKTKEFSDESAEMEMSLNAKATPHNLPIAAKRGIIKL